MGQFSPRIVHSLLQDRSSQLAPRPFPSGGHHDQDGRLRLIVKTITWEGYVRLAFDELRIAGASTPQVPRRLRAALEDLKTVAPPGRRPALDRQIGLLEEAVRRQFENDEDLGAAVTADQQGIGSAADLVAVDQQSNSDGPISSSASRENAPRPAHWSGRWAAQGSILRALCAGDAPEQP